LVIFAKKKKKQAVRLEKKRHVGYSAIQSTHFMRQENASTPRKSFLFQTDIIPGSTLEREVP
jgi:hypothetical protein